MYVFLILLVSEGLSCLQDLACISILYFRHDERKTILLAVAKHKIQCFDMQDPASFLSPLEDFIYFLFLENIFSVIFLYILVEYVLKLKHIYFHTV